MTTTHTLEKLFVDNGPLLADDIREKLNESQDFYIQNVRKAPWPVLDAPIVVRKITSSPEAALEQFGVTTHSVFLKQSAVNGPDICLDGFRYPDEVKDCLKQNNRVLASNAEWVWSGAFQDEVIRNCENRITVRKLTPELIEQIVKQARDNGNQTALTLVGSYQGPMVRTVYGIDEGMVQFPSRINFWGKRVHPYRGGRKGSCVYLNRKYRRAAEQLVVYHPEIVEFLFPDIQNWTGTTVWRCIPHADYNPDGKKGFFLFRMLFKYAARPIRPDFGTVITVLPPGLRGWLWYIGWKLMGKI